MIAFVSINVLLKVLCTKNKNLPKKSVARKGRESKVENNLYYSPAVELGRKSAVNGGYELPLPNIAPVGDNTYDEVRHDEVEYDEIGLAATNNKGERKI